MSSCFEAGQQTIRLGNIDAMPFTWEIMGLVHCIVNPASRDYTCGKNWPGLKQKMEEAGLEVKQYITERVGHGAQLSHSIRMDWENDGIGGEQKGKPPLVVAVGGDGIVHEVASGLRGSEVVLGQLPHGSGNDYAITHGIPRKKIDQAIQILINGKDRMCGAWRIEGYPCSQEGGYPAPAAQSWDGDPESKETVVRWAFLETDAGITSDISRAKLRRAKWIRGPMKYTYLGVTSIPFWPRRKVELTVDGDKPKRLNLTVFAATSGETFGGGYRIVPGMYPTRTNGSIVVAGFLNRLKMLMLMGPIKKGKHVGKWGIYQRDANKIRLRPIDDSGNPSDVPVGHDTYLQADGEPVIRLPASISWHHEQIKVRGALEVEWTSE